ncbi:polycystin-1 [Spea bombifrons]|uniref:polycystin-1 n=1 Tax=Spea bombifrons TaxID=233779 RepID=UPI00234B1436|nr:polycystin-1 [Spea bombifrons]
MHFGNDQAATQRKDGASPPALGLRLCPLFLVSAGLLLGLGSGATAGWCQPCPDNCTCTNFTVNSPCLVNCSARGLLEAASAPANVTTLDLSDNNITTLDKGLFEQLENLQELDLSGNSWVCDCHLAWLPRWAEDQGVTVLETNSTLCAQPSGVSGHPLFNVSFARATCGADFISCPRNLSAGNESVLVFTPVASTQLSNESCSALCFSELYTHGALDSQHGCLCGNTTSLCQDMCETPSILSNCGLTIIQDVFTAQLSLTIHRSKETYSLGEALELEVRAPIPITALLWDLGDQIINTTQSNLTHRYAQPGLYNVTVTLQVGNRNVVVHNEVPVVGSPDEIQIMCSSLVRTHESLNINVSMRGGTRVDVGYTVTSQRGETVSPACPAGSLVFPENNHCYQLVSEKADWFEAQRICKERGNGDLVIVRDVHVQDFLKYHIISGLEVWIGFNDSSSDDALDLQNCQNHLPGEPQPSQADRCVRMGPSGVCNIDLCSAKHSYVCDYKPQGVTLTANYFVLGSQVFEIKWPLRNLTRTENVSSPDGGVEVLIFPGLRFTQEVYLSALEFATRDLEKPVQMRFQVFTKKDGQSDAPESQTPMPDILLVNETLPECEDGLDWSNSTNSTFPEGSGCLPTNKSIDSTSSSPLPGQSYRSFVLLKEVVFTIPPGNSTHYLAFFEDVRIPVHPDHLLIVQHDGPNEGFLYCSSSEPCYYSVHQPNWMSSISENLLEEAWTNQTSNTGLGNQGQGTCMSCAIRVVGTTEDVAPIFNQTPNFGLWKPGHYTVTGHFSNQVFNANRSCSIFVVSPVSGLCVIYPTPQEDIIYVSTNNTALVLKILSGSNATASWMGSNQTWGFQRTCPPHISTLTSKCAEEEGDVWYSEILLDGLSKGFMDLVITVQNAISSQNITIPVKVEEPIRGLSANPIPQARVLLNTLVNNVASVEAGSDVVFKWMVDDRSSFTYYNAVFNVIYRSAAIYKLTLTASNHVSNATVNYNVTAEKMNPMHDFIVSGIPAVGTQNTLIELSASILVDSAVEAIFSWSFGDGNSTRQEYHYRPPYNQSFPVPNPLIHQVLIENNVTHSYQEPGMYNITVSVSNKYENVSMVIPLQIQSILTNLSIESEAEVIVLGSTVVFEAKAEPSHVGIFYIWDFGDGSLPANTSDPTVNHTFLELGVYNVSLIARNDINEIWVTKTFYVHEEITGLLVSSNEPTERGLQTFINASVETGDNITWNFSMGDGSLLVGNEPMVNHTYSKDGNYTVIVTASNPVNSVSESLHVHVYLLQVLKIEPSTCIRENPNVTLTAYVTGDYESYTFNWTFGNGTSIITAYGFPSVEYNFSTSGIYPLSLVLASEVNKAYYYTNICIEPEIVNVTILPDTQFIALGDESHFRVDVFPTSSSYRYVWDFGTNGSKLSSGIQTNYTYKLPGTYLISVSVFNNVSSNNDTALVYVQEPVGAVMIDYNGTNVLEIDQLYVFEAIGNGTNVTYYWDFGDGNMQTGQIVTQTYNSTGNFSIILHSKNDISNSTVSLNITVKTRIRGLSMNATRTVVPLNGSVTFSAFLEAGDDVHYSWILCDRCSPIFCNSTISYTFRSIGTFNVIVTAENEISSLQDSIVIYVLQMIEGLQIVSSDLVNDCCFPTNTSLPLQATVTDGSNISYSWLILKNDSVVQSGVGKTYQFTSLEAETYTVLLKAANMLGATNVSKSITFIERLGQLTLQAFPNPVAVNSTVNISMSLTSGSGVSYTWYLEDGAVWFTYESFVLYKFLSPNPKEVFAVANNTLGSVNSTITIFVEEPIEGVSISTIDHKGDHVPTGTVLYLDGNVERGSNVSWSWKLPDGSEEGKMQMVHFYDAGIFIIGLNASNDVSWETASKNITVQDKIQGLKLLVSKKVVEPGERVVFTILLSAGTSVSYKLTINGDYSILLNDTTYTHEFTKIGGYPVTVVATNLVSEERATVMISVLEAIKNLKIVNCCEVAIPARVEKSFRAEVSNGSLVAYTWQFDLQGQPTTSLAGRNVTYTPIAAGLLKIHLSASNDLGSQNITKIIKVQELIVGLTLKPVNAYVNRSVTFEAVVHPSPSEVILHWTFGDNSPALVTYRSTADHSYHAPGDYLVVVNASNLISFWIAQMAVTTRILECEEPVVQLELPTQVIMKRSQRNYIEANINLRGCISYQTEHLWEIFRASSCLHYQESDKVHLQNVDVSRPQLVVPKLALDIGDYCFVFSVSFGDTPLSKSSFANVTMMPSKLVPIIDGGSYRVWSNSRDLILDGEKSYDPNLEENVQTPLNYKWTCTKNSEPTGYCSDFGSESGVMIIPKSVLEPGVEYTFYLSISKKGMSPESTNQTVLIKKGSVPIVSLKCVSCKAQSVYEVSSSSYVYLEGSCSNCQDDSRSGRWTAQSFSNKTLLLDSSTTTTGAREMNLVLRQGVLKDGEGYTFTLHVSDPSMDEEGFASIDLLPNSPPSGGSCRIFPNKTIHALSTKIQFDCTGWRDAEDAGASLVFSLIVTRCREAHCDEFWVYKGSRSEHSTFLPVGFHEANFTVNISVVVQDQQGAATVALNHSQVIAMPIIPDGFPSLAHWLHNLTETTLQGLLKQGDPQNVAEYSLALITVLNEYEVLMGARGETSDLDLSIVRRNITDTLISLKVNTVDDIQQIAAALAQCTVTNKELICASCQRKTLNKLEAMMSILQNETTQGVMTPTTIADNILNIMGDVIHLVNTRPSIYKEGKLCGGLNSPAVASKAYNLSSDLMRILMKSRVLNEEPLTLQGGEILAWGKRSDPFNLLCYSNKTGCQFFIPQGFNSTFLDQTDIIQVMFQVDSNPYPFGFISNYTVSTKVASMAFQTSNGSQIPVESLDSEKAITVSVANNTGMGNITAGLTSVLSHSSVKVEVETESSNWNAGLHLQVTYVVKDSWYVSSEPEPFITVYLHESGHPNQYNYSVMKKIDADAMSGEDHKLYTFFIAPIVGNLTRHYYLNITNHYMWSSVDVTLGLYTSLCQYFDEKEMKWKTEGLLPLEDTRPDQAVCKTQHLTAFGASLFVPPHSVNFIHPPPPPGINYIVLLTCAVCFVTYAIATIIVHKLDLLDVNKAGVIPFCGKSGLFKYEVLVKTGWGRGSGTTAHVGISLYGVDDKSGHRHLDGENTFHRNSVDIFQIATESSLGNVWKIRLWHDNKGLSPSWYVQHVIIRDLQSSKNFFFLVNGWLSVGQEDSGRRVEREIFAASETELKRFSRIFTAELQRGISEKHVWLSMWDRPPRSRFTRVQRATCCALLIFLFLCANAVWYGVVGDRNHGDGAVSQHVPLSIDSVAVGMVTSVLVYPIYLFILFLFRRARSKTCVKQSLSLFDQQSLEIDNYLDTMVMESSFMTYTGIHGEAFSDQTKTDIALDDTKSFIQWNSNDGVLSWPDLLSDPSIMGNTIQKLERHRTCRHIGLDGSCHPSEEDSVVVGLPQPPARPFLASDDASSMSLPRDLRRISRTDTDLLSDLSNPFGDKTDTIILDKLNERGQAMTSPVGEVTRSPKSARTVITDAFQRPRQMLPSWCARVAHAVSCILLLCCFAVSVWIGVGFTSSIGLMWLISGIFSFLCSFFVLEPLKVLLEALYFALVVKRLHPEEEDTLVECPLVEKVSERITKVRPPQGFALFQAREEARKVKLLHRMLKNLVVYMLFFLIILLTNYGDTSRNPGAYLLQRSIKQELDSQRFLQIKRSDEFWDWASEILLPYLHNNHQAGGSYSNLLGGARLRQIRLKEAQCTDPSTHQTCPEGPHVFDNDSYDTGWSQSSIDASQTWTHSSADVTGDWFWGSLSIYDSSGYIQLLGNSLEENMVILENLQQTHWVDSLTRALFVEFSLYSPGVNLYSSVTLLLEFPFSGRALPSSEIRAFPLMHLSSDTPLHLTMMVFLMMFVVYFVLSECLVIRKEGCLYFTHFWNYVQWTLTGLSTCTVVVYLSRASLAERQWNTYLKDKTTFITLHQVAFLGSTFHGLSASLLFILTVKAAQQLRFIREWSVFGKTFGISIKELCAASGAVLGLVMMYAQLGFLLFSSSWENFHGFGSSMVTMLSMACGCISIKSSFPNFYILPRLFSISYTVLVVWILRRLMAAILISNYSQVRMEMFRPAFELQDYEMVELFLRRLRIWMGVSKVKEFRHKVRFEGMEPLPSRSSSDSKSIRGLTPSAASDTSSSSSFSTISSQLDTMSAGSTRETRERIEVDSNIQRLLPILETLLSQFDQVNHATEEVYRMECCLEEVQTKVIRRRSGQAKQSGDHPTRRSVSNSQMSTRNSQTPTTTQARKSDTSAHVTKSSAWASRPFAAPAEGLESSMESKAISSNKTMGEEQALIPMQITYSSQNKKRKSLRAHNRVHPSVS